MSIGDGDGGAGRGADRAASSDAAAPSSPVTGQSVTDRPTSSGAVTATSSTTDIAVSTTR
jgi:hypothetical protein